MPPTPKSAKSGASPKRKKTPRTSTKAKAKSSQREPSPDSMARRVKSVTSDNIRVARQFEGGCPRAIAPGLRGTAWTSEADGSLVVRAVPEGYELGRVAPYRSTFATCLLKVGETQMWAGYNDGALRVFDTDDLTVLYENTTHGAQVMAMSLSKNLVFVGGNDWKIYVYDSTDFHFERMLFGHTNSVRCLAGYVDPEDGVKRVASGGDDGLVKIWDPTVASERACLAELEGHDGSVLSALVLQDTAELWTGGEDGTVRVWDLYSLGPLATIVAQTAPVASLQLVEDNVWTGGKDGRITIFNRFTKELVHEASQPPSGTYTQRSHTLIQPVQRTVAHNVWASNASGGWQNWACVCPESDPAEAQRSTALISSRMAARKKTGGAGGEREADAEVLSPDEEARRARDAALRRDVDGIRRSVIALSDGDGEDGEDADEEADYALGDDDPVSLDAVEKSIARDRAEDEERRSRSQHGTASAAGESPAPAAPGAARGGAGAADAEQQRRENERIQELEAELAKVKRENSVNYEELGSMTTDLQTQREVNRQLQEQLEALAKQLAEKEREAGGGGAEAEAAAEEDSEEEL